MKIQWVKNIQDCIIENEIFKDTFLIYHEMYTPPNIQGIEYMKFQKFKQTYFNHYINSIIIVGLNRIITPSNRCDMVNDFLQTMTRNIPKISIDTSPFIGEPWRLWYHFDITNSGKFNVPHGYAIETEWKHWFYRDTNDCRLSGDNIGLFIDNVYSDLDLLTTEFRFTDCTNKDEEYYKKIKEFVFNKNNSPKLIINELVRECNKHFGINLSFDSYLRKNEIPIIVPDIGIYRFVVEENIRRQNIYNRVIR